MNTVNSQILKMYVAIFALLFSITLTTAQPNIFITPSRLGPNALPIPEIRMGRIENSILLRVAYENHSSDGDDTSNAYLQLDIPVVKDRVSFRMFIVPYERFTLTEATKAERNILEDGLEGTAGGDIYVETQIQLLRDKKYWPDMLLNIGVKTASGTNLEFARFSDTPGYLFDMSFGKTIWNSKENTAKVRLYAQTGVFIFQTERTVIYRQNDTFTYGIGALYQAKKWSFKNTLSGYRGYRNDGDRFNAYRATLRTHFDSVLNYEAHFQEGITYNDYTSFRLGLIFNLEGTKNWFAKTKAP